MKVVYSLEKPHTQNSMMHDYRIGEIWSSKCGNYAAVITCMYEKVYKDGEIAIRISGLLSTAPTKWWESLTQSNFDIDARSMEKLYPVRIFVPENIEDTEDK
jgi:hypothetical protein